MSSHNSNNSNTNKGNAASDVRDDPSVTSASLQSFLNRFGLDAAQVDGASLEALQDLLVDNGNDDDDSEEQKPPGYPSIVGPAATRNDHVHSPTNVTWTSLPKPSPQFWPENKPLVNTANDNDDSNNDNAATAGNSETDEDFDLHHLTPFERYVVQQLKHQNRMIADLHRRWDAQQPQQQNAIHSGWPPVANGIPPTAPPLIRDEHGENFRRHAAQAVPRPPAGWLNPHAGPPPPAAQPAREIPEPQQPQRLPPVTQWIQTLWQRIGALVTQHSLFLDTRVGRIVTLYWRLGRLHWRGGARNNNNNPPWDPFLLFKLLFMLAILSSKLRRRNNNTANDNSIWNWNIKVYTTAVVLLLGLLFQTGVLDYTYQFWFQRDYARRIWAGEDLPVDQAVNEETEWLEQPLRRRGAAAAAGGAELLQAWRESFLFGGRVAGVNNTEDAPPPSLGMRFVGILQDILFFFGSFVLSIFPMWRAAPRPPVVAVAVEENNENNNQDPAVGPGVVAPPVDPTGPEGEDGDNLDNANGPPPAQG